MRGEGLQLLQDELRHLESVQTSYESACGLEARKYWHGLLLDAEGKISELKRQYPYLATSKPYEVFDVSQEVERAIVQLLNSDRSAMRQVPWFESLGVSRRDAQSLEIAWLYYCHRDRDDYRDALVSNASAGRMYHLLRYLAWHRAKRIPLVRGRARSPRREPC